MSGNGRQPLTRLTACFLLLLAATLGASLSLAAPPALRLDVAITGAVAGVFAALLVGLQRLLRPRLGSRTAYAAVATGYGSLCSLFALLSPTCPLREGVASRCTSPELASFFLLGASSVLLLAVALWPLGAMARFVARTQSFARERAAAREEQARLAALQAERDAAGAAKRERIAQEAARVAARRQRRAERAAERAASREDRAARAPAQPAPAPTSPASGGSE